MRVAWMLCVMVGCAKSAAPEAAPAAAETGSETAMVDASEENRVRAVWEAYRQALMANDGPAIASMVASSTHAYYDALIQDAMHQGRDELLARDMFDVLMVTQLRWRLSPEELAALQGDTFEKLAADPTWVDPRAAQMVTELVKVEITDNKAGASWNAAPDQLSLWFLEEDGDWKVDMMAMLDMAREATPGDFDLASDAGQSMLLMSLNMVASMQEMEPLTEEGLDALYDVSE